MKVVDIETNFLDFVPDGETYITREGQAVVEGPVLIEGELRIEGHVII